MNVFATAKKLLALFMVASAAMFWLASSAFAQAHSSNAFTISDQYQPEPVVSRPRAGLFILDYQNIQLPENEDIDLIGYHILSPINEWAYVGLGGYAPFLKGEYGGVYGLWPVGARQYQAVRSGFCHCGPLLWWRRRW